MHSEKRKKTRQTEKEVERQHQGMNRPRIHQVQESSGNKRKMEETGCEVICLPQGPPAVKGIDRACFHDL